MAMIMMRIIILIMVVKHLSPITDNSRLIEVYWWFGASPYRLSRLCLPSNTIVQLYKHLVSGTSSYNAL